MRLRNIALAFTASLLGGCASQPLPDISGDLAEPLTAPTPAEGTVFVFDDGRVERFLRTDGDAHVWATRRGREYIRAANPVLPILEWQFGDRAGQREVFGDVGDLWPPRPGARAQFRVRTDIQEGERTRRSIQAWSCEVEGQTREDTPAGDFNVVPISCDRFSVNSMRALEKRTWWWSADLGHYVKRRYQNMRNGEVRQITLCAALPETRANDARIDAIVTEC